MRNADTSQTTRTKHVAGRALAAFHRAKPNLPQGGSYGFSSSDLVSRKRGEIGVCCKPVETTDPLVIPDPTPTAPDPPIINSIMMAPDNTQATVDFNPPADDGGSPILYYSATADPSGTRTIGSIGATGISPPITITGLLSNIIYTFQVEAVNAIGISEPATIEDPPVNPTGPPVNPTDPPLVPTDPPLVPTDPPLVPTDPPLVPTDPTSPTAPGAPTSVSALAGNAQATVSFTPPVNDGGSPIVSYTVTSNPGGVTATGVSSPIIVTGLTNGTPYTFTVVATNDIGDSEKSTSSNQVTPTLLLVRTVFTAGSGSWTAPSGVTSVKYLIVGGGGGGGAGSGTGAGGGGGGGSVKIGSISVTPGVSYNYKVGTGGTGGTTPGGGETNGITGENSFFHTIIAKGGGFGYKSREQNQYRKFGAGGAAQSGDTATTGGSGGNVRDGTSWAILQGAGGGGGGAGGAGATSIPGQYPAKPDNNRGGAGGPGITSDLKDGTNKIYGVGGKGADEGTAAFIGTLPGANGVVNTGNGGGGGASHWLGNNAAPGGTGGSGIVVLNYYVP